VQLNELVQFDIVSDHNLVMANTKLIKLNLDGFVIAWITSFVEYVASIFTQLNLATRLEKQSDKKLLFNRLLSF
jgi:hypothetical protein